MRRSWVVWLLVAVVVVAVAVAGLGATLFLRGRSGDTTTATGSAPAVSEPAEVVPRPAGDGTLTIGAVVPATGPARAAMRAGARLALDEVNDGGGVNGRPVRWVEGADGAELRAQGVDVVLGAPDRQVAVASAPAVAGTVQLFPFPAPDALLRRDTAGLRFTITPSDVAIGRATALRLLQRGRDRVAVLSSDGERGPAVARGLQEQLMAKGGTVAAQVQVPAGTTDFGPAAAEIVAAAPKAVVLDVPAGTSGAALGALLAKGFDPGRVAFLDGGLADLTGIIPASALTGAEGLERAGLVLPDELAALHSVDPDLENTDYAQETHDAVVVAALAAASAGTDTPAEVAAHLPEVSAGGTGCEDYAACLKLLKAGQDIDYEGMSGPVDLTDDGELAAFRLFLYRYEAATVPGYGGVILYP